MRNLANEIVDGEHALDVLQSFLSVNEGDAARFDFETGNDCGFHVYRGSFLYQEREEGT